MSLEPGDPMPAFGGTLPDGREWRSEDRAGRPIVVFFYPRDFTGGCTREVCAFRDAYDELRGLGAEVVGVSRDSVERHGRFREAHRLPFPLLSDADGRIGRAFGAAGLLPIHRRKTYVADAEGVVRGVFRHEFRIGRHVERTLQLLKSLSAKSK